eukprot:2162657-Pyramimonas_sp.AAC.1
MLSYSPTPSDPSPRLRLVWSASSSFLRSSGVWGPVEGLRVGAFGGSGSKCGGGGLESSRASKRKADEFDEGADGADQDQAAGDEVDADDAGAGDGGDDDEADAEGGGDGTKKDGAQYLKEYKNYIYKNFKDLYRVYDDYRFARSFMNKTTKGPKAAAFTAAHSASPFEVFRSYMNAHCVFSDPTLKAGHVYFLMDKVATAV